MNFHAKLYIMISLIILVIREFIRILFGRCLKIKYIRYMDFTSYGVDIMDLAYVVYSIAAVLYIGYTV